MPCIRTPGETLEVWLRGDGITNTSDFNVTIVGNGATYALPIINITESDGRWILTVRSDNDSIEDLYDIELKVDAQEQYQVNAVSMVKEYDNRFKFIQLTDLHIDDKNSVANFQKAVREINLIDPEFVIITGDSYDADPTGSKTPDQQQADMFMSICRGLNVPSYVIPGNHEYSYRNADGVDIYRNTINPVLDYSFNYGDHHFIGMNSGHWQRSAVQQVPHPDNNVESFSDQQVSWLTDDLVGHENDTMKLIFLHAPLKTESGKQTPMWHVDDVEGLMMQYDVKAFIAGHTHDNVVIDANDNVLEGDWQPPNYPIFIQTESSGAENSVEECNYRVFMIDNDSFEYYTYDDDGNGIRSARASTPTGYLDLSIAGNNDGTESSMDFTITNDQYENLEDGRVILNMAKPPRGITYCVEDGIVTNTINGSEVQMIHIRVSVPRKSQATFQIKQKDITPPRIDTVYSKVDDNISGVYEKGSVVEIIVQERNQETGLTGTLAIRDENGTPILISAPLTGAGGGRYIYGWDTAALPPGVNYSVKARLEDMVGNADEGDHLGDFHHNITLIDTVPPQVMRVTHVISDGASVCAIGCNVRIIVEEANSETGLSGIAEINLSSGRVNYSGIFSLVDEGEGVYSCIWDTTGLLAGRYGIETKLWDDSGNIVNGLGSYPDLYIQLIDDIPPEVHSVTSFVVTGDGMDDDREYPLGELIHFEVKEINVEENLTGEVIIMLQETETAIDTVPLAHDPERPGHYTASWNSHGHDEGTYYVDVTLMDDSGNVDPDGAPGTPDHFFTLVDLISPTVIASAPADGEENVPIFISIRVGFSEPLIDSTLLIGARLRDEYSNEIPFQMEWSSLNSTAIFSPDHILSYHRSYELILTTRVRDRAGNPLEHDVEIRFTTQEFVSTEKINTSHTVFPPQERVNLYEYEKQNFSMELLDPKTRELNLYYSWYLNDLELTSGPNSTEYCLNATKLQIENSYELKVSVIGEKVSLSYIWTVKIIDPEPAGSKGDPTDGVSSGGKVMKWAFLAGFLVILIGLVMIPLYMFLRRRSQKRLVENEVTEFLIAHEGNGDEDEVDDDGVQMSRKNTPDDLEIEVFSPQSGESATTSIVPYESSCSREITVIDMKENSEDDIEGDKNNTASLDDSLDDLREIVDDFIRQVGK